ncbi:hypothetical protein L3X38_035458 [Prunus dulcis]|uniref:F-box associated domain-containing protein n=1 Tax=Prunus dulcis TaxID=3755 RepID=A0AAD4VJQ8_PRUDU|nr:hypothetical protein L3X38_035458 [Prunus dulcis]
MEAVMLVGLERWRLTVTEGNGADLGSTQMAIHGTKEFTDRESEPWMFRFNNLKFAFYNDRPIAIISNPTVRFRPNLQDVYLRPCGTLRNIRIVKHRLWVPWARLTRFGKFDCPVDRVSPEAIPSSELVWVLDDFYGAEGSWTKHLTFEPLVGIKRVLEFWKSEEILMVTEYGDIVSYNLETEKLKNLPRNSPSDFETSAYVNSLVTINHRRATSLRV